MTVGTKEADVLQSIVEPIAADVINNEAQRLAEPRSVAATDGTHLGDTRSHHRPAQPVRLLSARSGWKDYENLLGRKATGIRSAASATVRLAREMAGIEASCANAAGEIGM
jgi:hypothetical protein